MSIFTETSRAVVGLLTVTHLLLSPAKWFPIHSDPWRTVPDWPDYKAHRQQTVAAYQERIL